MKDKEPMVTWIYPKRIKFDINKEGEFYIYDYKEYSPMLPEKTYGKDDTQNLMDSGFIKVPDCEVIKFKSDGNMVHAILKTKNPLRIIAHLVNELDYLGRKPKTEKDILPRMKK